MDTATCRQVYPGEIFNLWCSKHGQEGKIKGINTDHLWNGHKLICLVCSPEVDPRNSQDSPESGDAMPAITEIGS